MASNNLIKCIRYDAKTSCTDTDNDLVQIVGILKIYESIYEFFRESILVKPGYITFAL